MYTENFVITDENGKAIFIGAEALKYADLRIKNPVCYPKGYIEKGDILIYLSKNLSQIVKLYSVNEESEYYLIISTLVNDDINPIIKIGFDISGKLHSLINTIYERTEIEICAENNKIFIRADELQLEADMLSSQEFGCILRRDELIYFTPSEGQNEGTKPLYQVLTTGVFDQYIDEKRLRKLKLQGLVRDTLYNKIEEVKEDTFAISVNESGKSIMIEKNKILLHGRKFFLYSFYSKNELIDNIIEKTKCYNMLKEDERQTSMGELRYNSFRLWGGSDKLLKLEQLLQKASVTNSTILLLGESGTGKTFLAREIHNFSKRATKPFVHVNCAAIPYHLMESELFGYEDGAFTGAKKGGKIGLFEMAYGGTLFLDEISEIPLALQGKLLEVIQSKTFFRVGGTNKLTVDVRLIAASNKNLKELVVEKNFREDLYYRINVFPIEIPPLRERAESIQAIIGDILPDICDRLEIEPVTVGYNALEKLRNYYWPGNIRQLENVLEKAAILCEKNLIMPDDIVLPEKEDFSVMPRTLREIKEKCERDAIKNALEMFHGDKIRAANYLDIGRTNMFEKVKKYRLDLEGSDGYDFR